MDMFYSKNWLEVAFVYQINENLAVIYIARSEWELQGCE